MIVGGELNKKYLIELCKVLVSMELLLQKCQWLIWCLVKYGVIVVVKRYVCNQEFLDGQKWLGCKIKCKGKMLCNLLKLFYICEMFEIQVVWIYLQGGGYWNGEVLVLVGIVGYV